jgi:hypothetical protein
MGGAPVPGSSQKILAIEASHEQLQGVADSGIATGFFKDKIYWASISLLFKPRP